MLTVSNCFWQRFFSELAVIFCGWQLCMHHFDVEIQSQNTFGISHFVHKLLNTEFGLVSFRPAQCLWLCTSTTLRTKTRWVLWREIVSSTLNRLTTAGCTAQCRERVMSACCLRTMWNCSLATDNDDDDDEWRWLTIVACCCVQCSW